MKEATLATKATRGGGPPFQKFGSRALYRWADASAVGEAAPECAAELDFRSRCVDRGAACMPAASQACCRRQVMTSSDTHMQADRQSRPVGIRLRPPRLGELCRELPAGCQRENTEILRARRLLDESVSLERAWSEIKASRGRAAASTVEALMFSLRAGGAALACPHARRRLAELSEAQLHEVCARLQKIDPNIARAWTPIEVELLVAVWNDLHG